MRPVTFHKESGGTRVEGSGCRERAAASHRWHAAPSRCLRIAAGIRTGGQRAGPAGRLLEHRVPVHLRRENGRLAPRCRARFPPSTERRREAPAAKPPRYIAYSFTCTPPPPPIAPTAPLFPSGAHQQVLRSERPGDARAIGQNRLNRFPRAQVLEYYFKPRGEREQLRELGANKDALTVENIDRRVGHLPVDAEGHAELGHRHQGRLHLGVVGDATVRVGGGARRVQLDSLHVARGGSGPDLVGRRAVGQVHGHQRDEAAGGSAVGRHRCRDPRLVLGGHYGSRDGRHQVGHDDGAGKLAGRGAHSVHEHVAITQVMVPVVRTAQRDLRQLALESHAIVRGGEGLRKVAIWCEASIFGAAGLL
eukprot:scaffold4589_cov106-Isochrysis_galbana.AAC.8